ncbi:MAG: thiamine-phosphate kinase [Bacteroidales bacterium]|nr:thiamine-phosphate kinase [Bacteroidales bacterium]
MFEDRTKPRTEIKDLGEFGLIDHLTGDIELVQESSKYGVGDDAAVIDPKGKKVLISTDMLMEGIHFDLTYAPLKHLGYKAAIVNFSDMAAMNALPTQITVSIALSNRFSLEAVEELYKGLKLACKAYNVDIVGGDTTSSKSGLAISITVLGLIDEKDIVYRNGAKEGDLICVSGDLGAAYAGLLILEREKSAFVANPDMKPQLEDNDYILERQLKPEARVDIVKILKDSNIKLHAMMDVSDGLASEVKHICKQSKLGAAIYEDKLPIDQKTWDAARVFNMDPTMFALNGGEDYELLFTVPQSEFEKLKNIPEVSIIGYTTDMESGINLITKNNVSAPLEAQGWDGLKTNKKTEE